MSETSEKSWVRKVAPWALGGLALAGAAVPIAKKYNFPERLFNDHGDVALNPHKITDYEIECIERHFANIEDTNLNCSVSFKQGSKELIERFAKQSEHHTIDIQGSKLYIGCDSKTKQIFSFLIYGDRQGDRENTDSLIIVIIDIPNKILLPKSQTYANNMLHIRDYLETRVPEIKELIDLARTTREEKTTEATGNIIYR